MTAEIDGSLKNSPRPPVQIVRGETELVSAAATTSTSSLTPEPSPDSIPLAAAVAAEGEPLDKGNAGGSGPWKPLNGAGLVVDKTPVMGDWPTLSKKALSKNKSFDKALPPFKSSGNSNKSIDKALPPFESSGNSNKSFDKALPPVESSGNSTRPCSESSSNLVSDQGHVISGVPINHDKVNLNANHNVNHGNPNRHKPMKKGNSGGGIGVGGGSTGFIRPPPPPPPLPLPAPMPPNLVSDCPVRGEGPSNVNSTNLVGNNRNNSRRGGGNFGVGRPRGDGYVNGNGGRRHDQSREWRGPRGFRDDHMSRQMVPPPLAPPLGFRPPHLGGAPFIPHQPMIPFGNHMGFDAPLPYPYIHSVHPELRGPPLMPHAGPMFYPPHMDPLFTLILNQIEYYFSEDNLVKDTYLRSKMDNEGWVAVSVIANFKLVKNLTNDIQLILNCLRISNVVEVQGERIRPRNHPEKWASLSTSLQNLSVEGER